MIKTALSVFLTTLALAGTSRADVPSVAVDIAPVHSLVAQVMGTLGEPDLVIASGASPHGYSLRPSEAQALQDANIVFWVSAELTPWLSDSLVTLASDATRIELLEVDGTTELPLREGALFEAHEHHSDEGHTDEHSDDGEHHDDHGHSDSDEHHDDEHHEDEHTAHDDEHEHGEIDAHAWLDPSNAAVWLGSIANVLAQTDPANADTYMANAMSAKADLKQLETDIEMLLAPARGRNFIVFHDAYQYFEEAFDFSASGAISLSDASKPSPARIAEIQDRVTQANVTCVLAEPQYNPELVKTVISGTEANSSTIDPLGSNLEVGPAFYTQLLRQLAKTLAECV